MVLIMNHTISVVINLRNEDGEMGNMLVNKEWHLEIETNLVWFVGLYHWESVLYADMKMVLSCFISTKWGVTEIPQCWFGIMIYWPITWAYTNLPTSWYVGYCMVYNHISTYEGKFQSCLVFSRNVTWRIGDYAWHTVTDRVTFLSIYTLRICIYLEDRRNSGSDNLYLSFYKINYLIARRLSSASPPLGCLASSIVCRLPSVSLETEVSLCRT